MEKEFIPYEQALALKELGFDEMCFATYNMDYNVIRNPSHDMADLPIEGQPYYWQNSKIHINNVTAPLYQQVFRWFRKNYNLNANVYKWQPDFSKSIGHLECEGSVTHFTEKKVGRSEYFNTYEEAEIFCLKKLIEIVKNK